MDKYDEYLDFETRKSSNRKARKKILIPTVAAITALATAGAAIAVSAAPAEAPAEAEGRIMLSVTDESSVEDTASSSAGFVLTDVSDVVKEALPSVVSITSRSLVEYFGNSRGGEDFGEIWSYFFGDSFGGRSGRDYSYREYPDSDEEEADAEPEEIDTGLGSGTIVAQNDDELLILTSYHVVEDGSSLYVTFIDGTNVDGTVKAADSERDIAVVSVPIADIPAETLEQIKVATISTEDPEVGDGCIVIGNALGYGISVTSGIISALDREVYTEVGMLKLLQTDAAINNGNSGGCMLNAKGEVIGISEAKNIEFTVEGMCYAIPVKENLDLIQDLLNGVEPEKEDNNNVVSQPGQAFLGIIRGRDVTDDLAEDFGMPTGVYVYSTVAGGGAEEAGIMSGDIIVGIDDTEISSFEELQYELSLHNPGDQVTLKINRLVDGVYTSMDIDVTLTERLG